MKKNSNNESFREMQRITPILVLLFFCYLRRGKWIGNESKTGGNITERKRGNSEKEETKTQGLEKSMSKGHVPLRNSK